MRGITREEAIEQLEKAYKEYVDLGQTCRKDSVFWKRAEAIKAAIKALEQEPKTGHWIIYDVHGHKACKCSECDKDAGYPCNYKYCPYCGERMVESKELSE